MKKKTIYVVIAIAVVAILAIGFQTAPKTPDLATDSYNRTVRWPNQAQIDELQSRLISLSGAKKTKEFGDALTLASIEIGLHDGSSINFQSKNDGTLQLICQPSSQIIEARNDGILMLFGRADPKVYLINNEDFHHYVINLCSGGDTALATKSG